MQTNELNHHLNLIAADLLKMAAKEFRACHPRTYYFPDTPEIREWLAFHRVSLEKSEVKGQLLASNFRMMHALAKHLIQKEAKDND